MIGSVHIGTKNNKAGWGWLKIYITANVSTIPKKYPIMQVLKYVVLRS